MANKKVKLERLMDSEYGVNYDLPNGTMLRYVWKGSKPYKRDIVEVEQEVYEYLKYSTSVFQTGKLVLVDEKDKEDLAFIINEEDMPRVYTREEVVALLNGTPEALKEELDNMEERDLANKKFFISIAKETKLDSSRKKKILAESIGQTEDILFPEEEIVAPKRRTTTKK